jgi:hypothetical protein
MNEQQRKAFESAVKRISGELVTSLTPTINDLGPAAVNTALLQTAMFFWFLSGGTPYEAASWLRKQAADVEAEGNWDWLTEDGRRTLH